MSELFERIRKEIMLPADIEEAIDAELAKPEPEPVAEIIRHFNDGNFSHVSVKFLTNPDLIAHGAKLYTHPPAHQKPLSDVEIAKYFFHPIQNLGTALAFARAIERRVRGE